MNPSIYDIPTPAEIRTVRESCVLTQTQAADLVHAKCRTWQQWEAGDRRMHVAFWELFLLKSPSAKRMLTTYAVFLYGSRNAFNTLGCVWVGEAEDFAHAKSKALEEGVCLYPGQFLLAKHSTEFSFVDRCAVAEWQSSPRPW